MNLKLYEIRCCKKEEYGKLVQFFREYWNENHIFCKSKEIFEFQHGKAERGYYDFLVAVHKETEEFHAVLGFIRSSLYDDGEDYENPQAIYGALWKVREDVRNKEIGKLGLAVLFELVNLFPNSVYITLGLSKYSQSIYKAMHYDFGIMTHYYIANKNKKNYEIIVNPHFSSAQSKCECRIERMADAVEIENRFIPSKTPEYIRNRYLRHPFYKYELLGIYRGEELLSEWIIRKISVGDANCIRIIDMVGDLEHIENISEQLTLFMENENCEYIDCYNHGVSPECFIKMGFVEKDGDTVVPNYFEPFEKTNVDIYYAAYRKDGIVIFKGDADQDRPSMI
jgi:hypothetical protein